MSAREGGKRRNFFHSQDETPLQSDRELDMMESTMVKSGGVRRGTHASHPIRTAVSKRAVVASKSSVRQLWAAARCGFFFLLGFFFISATLGFLAAAESDGSPEPHGDIPLSTPGQVLPSEVLDAALKAVQGFPEDPAEKKTASLGVKRDALQEALGEEMKALKEDEDLQVQKVEEMLKQKQKHWEKVLAISSGAAGVGGLGAVLAGVAKSRRPGRHDTALTAAQFLGGMMLGFGLVTAIKYGIALPLLKKSTPEVVSEFRKELAKDRRGVEDALAMARRRHELAREERAVLLAPVNKEQK